MKIAFVTTFDPRDVRRGSGTFYHMSREIARQGHAVHHVGPLTYRVPPLSKLIAVAHRRLGRRHALFLDPWVGRELGRQVTAQLASAEYEALITNDVAVAGYTRTARPIALYTDVMITPDYSEKGRAGARLGQMTPLSLALARRTIRRGLQQAALCVFPAQWVADAAFHYAPVQAKTHIIPFGANIDDPGPQIAAARAIPPDAVDLLFIGKDWVRKGGETAVAAVQALRAQGVRATLHVVGAPATGSADPAVRFYGLLDKADPAQNAQLVELLRTCHVFILPTQSEGFVIAVLEAAAFGMPAVVYAADGVGVLDGQTGRVLPLGAPPAEFAAVIRAWQRQPEQYRALAAGARRHFDATVNWTTAVGRLMQLVGQLVR